MGEPVDPYLVVAGRGPVTTPRDPEDAPTLVSTASPDAANTAAAEDATEDGEGGAGGRESWGDGGRAPAAGGADSG